MKSEFDKIEERRKASPTCLLPDSETVYKGLFWFVGGGIVTVKIPCDSEGTIPSDYPFLPSALSKSGDNYTHKDAWMHLDESITKGHPYNYYPRGRVEIKKGKATVYCNPSLADEEHMDAVKDEFRLDIQHGIEKVTVKADRGSVINRRCNMKTCCFTGHRYLSEWNIGAMRAELERAIDRATSEGYYHFIAGNAVGVDTMAAQIVLQKKENDPRITLEIAIPFEGHNAHIEEIAEMQKKADFAHVVSNVKSRCKAFVERDRYMVAKSDRVIAVVHIKRNEIKMGGTKRTVDYAKSEGKEIELIGLTPKLIRRSHEHIHQKYVPYSELMEIMRDMYCQDNLIYCLTFGKNTPCYNEKLMLVAQKLEFVSSLFYQCDGVPKKLPREMYERFFDDYVESESEACERLVRLGGDCRSAPLVYEKYEQIKAALLPLLCDTDEVWVADEMRDVVEYILDHDTIPNGFNAKQCFKDRDLDYGNFYN